MILLVHQDKPHRFARYIRYRLYGDVWMIKTNAKGE